MMNITNMKNFFIVSVFLCILTSTSSGQLSCQLPGQYLRLLTIHDMNDQGYHAPTVTALNMFLNDLHLTMPNMVAGRGVFSDKAIVTGDAADTCWDYDCAFNTNPLICANIVMDNRPTGASQLDALYGAVDVDWNSAVSLGPKVLMLFSPNAPATSTGLGLPPLTPPTPLDCDAHEYPAGSVVETRLSDEGVALLVFTTSANHYAYNEQLGGLNNYLGVFELSDDPDEMEATLWEALDYMFCIGQTTTEPPVPTTITETVTTAPTTSTEFDCPSTVALQLLVLQDMSYSYNNDLEGLIPRYSDLLDDLANMFGFFRFGLGSFVDKPIEPAGRSYDYCWREELGFTTDKSLFMDTIEGLSHLSGYDWRESQLDAIKFGVTSSTLGWDMQLPGGLHDMRVILLATDAGAHRAGDLGSLPVGDLPCDEADYPTFADIEDVYNEKGIFPIYLVTGDVVPSWEDINDQTGGEGVVIGIVQSNDAIIQAIEDAVLEYCQAKFGGKH